MKGGDMIENAESGTKHKTAIGGGRSIPDQKQYPVKQRVPIGSTAALVPSMFPSFLARKDLYPLLNLLAERFSDDIMSTNDRTHYSLVITDGAC